jgi:hypothetical protein
MNDIDENLMCKAQEHASLEGLSIEIVRHCVDQEMQHVIDFKEIWQKDLNYLQRRAVQQNISLLSIIITIFAHCQRSNYGISLRHLHN